MRSQPRWNMKITAAAAEIPFGISADALTPLPVRRLNARIFCLLSARVSEISLVTRIIFSSLQRIYGFLCLRLNIQ